MHQLDDLPRINRAWLYKRSKNLSLTSTCQVSLVGWAVDSWCSDHQVRPLCNCFAVAKSFQSNIAIPDNFVLTVKNSSDERKRQTIFAHNDDIMIHVMHWWTSLQLHTVSLQLIPGLLFKVCDGNSFHFLFWWCWFPHICLLDVMRFYFPEFSICRMEAEESS